MPRAVSAASRPYSSGVLVADLPRAVHLVAQAPHLDAVAVRRTVGAALVGKRSTAVDVAVLQQVHRLLGAAGAQVDGHHGFHAGLGGPRREFVHAHQVGVRGVPGQVEAYGPLVLRPHAVLPAVAGDEVAAGVPHGGDAQFPGQVQDIAAETVLVGVGVVRLEDAGVDAPAQVLHEGAERAAADGTNGEGRVKGYFGGCRFWGCHEKTSSFSFDLQRYRKYCWRCGDLSQGCGAKRPPERNFFAAGPGAEAAPGVPPAATRKASSGFEYPSNT